MSATSLTTADELLVLSTGMGRRYELVAGELRVMPPSGWRHGSIVSKLHSKLAAFVDEHELGMMFGAETGFRLASDPDTVRAPDVAFIAKQNVPSELPEEGFWPGAPDLTVEVLSPGDRPVDVNEKTIAWLDAGCAAVWVVDPQRNNVTVHLSRTVVHVKSAEETLPGDPVVPGFSCAVSDLFR